MTPEIWRQLVPMYDADLVVRLKQAWDEISILEQLLGQIEKRTWRKEERLNDPEQAVRIENLIASISRRVDDMMLTRELLKREALTAGE